MAVITVQMTSRTAEQVGRPIVYTLGHDFQVVPTIRRAQVSEDYGFMEVDIEGAIEEVQRAISWLHTTGMSVDARQRSVTDDSNL